jgi:hypothetical protein
LLLPDERIQESIDRSLYSINEPARSYQAKLLLLEISHRKLASFRCEMGGTSERWEAHPNEKSPRGLGFVCQHIPT